MEEILDRILVYIYDLNPSLEPIGLITLGVSVLSLLYAMRSYGLQRESFRFTTKREEQKEKEIKEERRILEERARRQVPDGISFGKELLILPTMKEAGIPEGLGYLGIFQLLIKKGDWVKRGEPLLTVHYKVFENGEKPRWWFMSDPTYTTESISLKSPVSGLVVAFREEYAASVDYGSIEYRERELFPIILLPENEAPQERWEGYFYKNMVRELERNWFQLAYCGYRHVRIKEREPDLRPQFPKGDVIEHFEVRNITPSDTELLGRIQKLRAYSTDLHNKLVHLVKPD